MARVLITTTSFQDTPGPHHDVLAEAGYELVRERGPLPEERMLELVGDIDAMICGDDAITAAVIDRALPRLKVISKYGIGLDKIDVAHATRQKLPVLFTPGVNHTTVAEHTFALLLALVRNLVTEVNHVAAGEWTRITGHEIMGRTIGIVGLGRIGKEVAIRANAFAMPVIAYDVYWDADFARIHNVEQCESLNDLIARADIVSLHAFLSDDTRHMINAASIARMKQGTIVLNCARGELVDTDAVVDALESGQLGGYGTDVLDEEPPTPDHPLLTARNCIITPHIGSRTYESVQRQAGKAVKNLIEFLSGGTEYVQANKF